MNFIKTKLLPLFVTTFAVLAMSGCGSSAGNDKEGAEPIVPPSVVVLDSVEIQRADAYKTFAADDGSKLIMGTSVQAKAIGHYSDGSQKDISSLVTWSDDGKGASVNASGLITAHTVGEASVSATKTSTATGEDITGTVEGEVLAATLVSVAVFGDNESPVGRAIQLKAIATFDVDISVDVTDLATWNSSNSDITVVKGNVDSIVEGSGEITATFQDANTPPVSITSTVHPVNFVTEVIDHLEIQKNSGVSCEGEAINGIKQTLELVDKVSYPPELSANAFYPIVCAVYTNGNKEYVNQDAIWWSSDQQVAQVNYLKGSFVFGTDLGSDVIISTKYDGLEATFPVDVIAQSGKTLNSIFITNVWTDTPPITTLAMEVGDKTPLVAWGNFSYSDGRPDAVEYINQNVSWESDDLGVAWIYDAINSDVSALSTGSATVTATWHGKSASVAVTVTPTTAYTSIEIQNGNGEILNAANPLVISQGQAQYITAWGVRDDGTKIYINTEVLWSSDDQAIASMDLGQRNSYVTGVAAGTTAVNAVGSGHTGTAPVEVVPHDGILEANIRWEKDGSLGGLPGTSVVGKTAFTGHVPILDPSTSIWYFVRAGQGYTKGTTIDKINLSFTATLDGGLSGVHLNVYMYDDAGNKVKANILNDADWTAYQAAHPSYVIRTDYYEISEGEAVQCNFILRLGDSTYKGRNKDFTIDKFEVTTTP